MQSEARTKGETNILNFPANEDRLYNAVQELIREIKSGKSEVIAELRGIRSEIRIMSGAKLKREDACCYLGVSLSQFEKFQTRGLITPQKLGRKSMYSREALEEFAKNYNDTASNEDIVLEKMRQAKIVN